MISWGDPSVDLYKDLYKEEINKEKIDEDRSFLKNKNILSFSVALLQHFFLDAGSEVAERTQNIS